MDKPEIIISFKIFNPYNNVMKDVESRIATFQNKWKTTIKQTPEMMAIAGFYCVGMSVFF